VALEGRVLLPRARVKSPLAYLLEGVEQLVCLAVERENAPMLQAHIVVRASGYQLPGSLALTVAAPILHYAARPLFGRALCWPHDLCHVLSSVL
jgi:hypothetical protein